MLFIFYINRMRYWILIVGVLWLVHDTNAQCNCTASDCENSCSAGQYYDASGPGCSPCPSGYYCPGGTGGSLIACSEGKYNPDTRQSDVGACNNCSTDEISASGSTACIKCPAGKECTQPNSQVDCKTKEYSETGDMTCHTCPPGSICPSKTVAPQSCANGTEPNTAQTACEDCTAGTYKSSGHDTCQNCPKGSECPSNGMTAATACTDGYYQDQTGQTSCSECPPGSKCPDKTASPETCSSTKYSVAGSMNCSTCSAGQVPNGNQSGCENCAAGTYRRDSDATCQNCPAGSKCPIDGMTEPTACPDGEYQSSTQQTTCLNCTQGHECSNKANAPNPCAAGTYAAANSITCTACDAGEYSTTGQSSCSPCPGGQNCSDSSTITNCTAGMYSPVGFLGCTSCQIGYYSHEMAENCTICPAGYSCSDPSSEPVVCSAGYASAEGVAAFQNVSVATTVGKSRLLVQSVRVEKTVQIQP